MDLNATQIPLIAEWVDKIIHQRLLPYNIGTTQAMVLINLAKSPAPMRASDLAHSIYRDPKSFAPILDRLESTGYIVRVTDPHDRRAIRITLTEQGKQFVGGVKAAVNAATKDVRAAFEHAGVNLDETLVAFAAVRPPR